MKTKLKSVTSLGLGLVLTTGVLSACDGRVDEAPPAPAADVEPIAEPAAPTAEAAPTAQRVPDAGEGGEGEGGIAVADASTNAVVYNSALAITAAHVFAARDAHLAGEVDAAAEMLAHPVSEVLLDMEPIFEARGVTPFGHLLTEASAAVFDGETPEQIAVRSDAILEALRAASALAPDDGMSQVEIAAGVTVDQIDRAADMYRIARYSGDYGPYLDGYGFYKAAEMAYAEQADAIEAQYPEIAARISVAFEVLSRAYPSALMPDSLDIERPELASASTQAMLAYLNR